MRTNPPKIANKQNYEQTGAFLNYFWICLFSWLLEFHCPCKTKSGLHQVWGEVLIGNENSARSFSDRSFLSPPSGHGRPRLRVMDVRTDMLVFPGFRGPDRSFCPRTSAGISAWTSAGYPALKLTLWAAFSLLS